MKSDSKLYFCKVIETSRDYIHCKSYIAHCKNYIMWLHECTSLLQKWVANFQKNPVFWNDTWSLFKNVHLFLRKTLFLFKNVQVSSTKLGLSQRKFCIFLKNACFFFENICPFNQAIFRKPTKPKYSFEKFLRTLH